MINQSRPNDIVEVSKSASYYSLISLIVVFLVIVTYGWSTMLTSIISLPDGWPEILSILFTLCRYAAGFAIAAAGIVLGKAVAAERIRISSEDAPKYRNTWKAYFIVLLVISALGTMNTMFMGTQQSGVLGDAISRTTRSLQQLESKIDEKLATPSYDQQRTDIQLLREQFEMELRNKANCGFGAQASRRFRDLQVALPKLVPLSIGSGACTNVEAVIADYKRAVERLTDDLPNPETKKRFQHRNDLIFKIKEATKAITEMKDKSVSLSKAIAVPALTAAWTIYAQALSEAELIAGSSFDLPTKIEEKNIQGMGNITQIIPLMISQFDSPVTYVIIAAAVFFDILLIEFFARYFHSHVAIRRETKYNAQPGAVRGRSTNLFEDQR
jgi:hypothetical protein